MIGSAKELLGREFLGIIKTRERKMRTSKARERKMRTSKAREGEVMRTSIAWEKDENI
jgi:hypothetical protein